MKDTSWKDVAELVGIAAIVASLIFVGVQVKQTQRAGEGEDVDGIDGQYQGVS